MAPNIASVLAVLCISIYQSQGDPYPIDVDDNPGIGRMFYGIGGLSGGGATSKLLVNYPEQLRDQILDFLFKPNFGASLQVLKVEIGGDAQSTDGTEASHMHNKWDENYQRGYEWWLMKEAKKRNPKIKLYGLPWAFPGWIGEGKNDPYVNVTQTAEYIMKWVKGAQQVHGLRIDYLGLRNESPWSPDYAKELRRVLDLNGFTKVQILAADGFKWVWTPSENIIDDPDFAKAVDFIGAHYTGTFTSPAAKACGRPLWSSEDWSTKNDEVGGGCWARLLNQNYVNGLMTSTIAWNLIASYYEHLPYYRTGLMTAAQPWSGYYEVNTPIWVSAHTTQFTEIGWFYLKHGSGVGRLPLGGSYVSFVSPDSTPFGHKDLTVVFETMTHNHSMCVRPGLPDYNVETQQITLVLKGTFAVIKEFMVWKSVIGFNGAKSRMFERQDNITVTDGKVTVGLGLDEVLTLTTITTGLKGQYPDPPAPKSFILPYSDDFEGYDLYEEPYNLAQQTGSFEVLSSNNNKFVRQMVLETPVHWCGADSANRAINVIGSNWTDVFVETDFNISPVNGSTGVFVAARVQAGGGCGAQNARGIFLYALPGKYVLSSSMSRVNKSIIAQGDLAFKAGEWHKLSLLVHNTTLQGSFDGKGIFNVTLSKWCCGNGFAAIGTDSYGLADFDNLKLDTKSNGQNIMRKYFDS